MVSFTKLIEEAREDKEILAVIVYGSYARGEECRDVDICLVLDEEREVNLVRKIMDYMKEFDFDFRTFQELPLYIKIRVLKEGKVLFVRDEDKLYEIAIRTVREFEDFKPGYKKYIEGVVYG